MSWTKVEPYAGDVHQGCLNCPPVTTTAPMDMTIAVGFGMAYVTRDRDTIFSERPDDEEWHTLAEFEAQAAADPDHDWRVTLDAALRNRTYQRHGPGEWVLIESGPGFA